MKSRSRKFIRTDVQLRVILAALSVAGIVLFINFCLVLLCLNSVHEDAGATTGSAAFATAIQFAVTKRFLLSIGISIPVAAAIGVVYSFRFAGPIYSIHRYFKGIESLPWDKRCSLRKGDDLQDVCTSINVGMDKVRGALRESRDICAQIQSAIQNGEIDARQGASLDLKALQERAANLERSISERFPNDRPQGDSPAGSNAPNLSSTPVAALQA